MFSNLTSNKSSIIQNARAARIERANQKLQEQSVCILQSYIRSYLTRKKTFKNWRNEIDDIIGLSKDSEDTNKTSSRQVPSSLDKIDPNNKNLSMQQWQFASFGSNTLTGIYKNFSSLDQSKKSDCNETLMDVSEPSQTHSNSSDNKTKINNNTSEESNTSVQVNSSIPATELFIIIRKILFIFDNNKDQKRFRHLCEYILRNVENETSIKISYVALSLNKSLALEWITQVKKVLWTVCKLINKTQSSDSQNNLVCLQMLITFTDISSWKSLQKQKVLHYALKQICSNILCDIQRKGCIKVIGSILISNVMTMNNQQLHYCFIILMRQVISSNYNKETVRSFALEVLTVPSLIWQLYKKSPESLEVFKSKKLLSYVLTHFYVDNACPEHGLAVDKKGSNNCVIHCLCLLANLVHLLVLDINVLNDNTTKAVNLLNQLLTYLYVNTTQQKSNATTWHPILGYFSQSSAGYSDTMPFVKMQLEYLWKPDFVRSVFHDVLTLESLHDSTALPTQAEQIVFKSSVVKSKLSTKISSYLRRIVSSRPENILLPTGGRKLEYDEVKNTCTACILYKKTLTIFTRQLQLEMLTGLTFMDDVLCRLWRFICELGPRGGLELFLSALTLSPTLAEPYFAVFTLFCDMTSHILSILDDVEFYEQQVPFHLEELLTISEFLRQFVFKVIWNRLVTVDTRGPMYPIFDSSHTLLMMLYDRDARRPFTPPDHWLCKSVRVSSIRNAIESSEDRAKFLLNKIPFVIPHKERVIFFRSLVMKNRSLLGITPDSDSATYIRVHRSRLVSNGFEQLNNLPVNALKGTIRVKFINDLGLDEAGIDQDGVFKEFLEETVRKVFNPDMNLFRVTNGEESKLYPSPLSHLQDDHLTLFNFVGRILGKAVYEGIVLDIPFANFFLRHLLGQQHQALYSPIDELPSLDKEFYKNLTWIKRYEGDISELGLTFTYEEDVMGKIESRELVPGGNSITVTNENRFMYIHTLAHYRLHTQIKQQTRAFIQGFRSLIAPSWTSIFSAPELQRLISGDNVDVDLSDLKSNVMYYGGFHSSHRVIKWLWDIIERDYTPSERAAFLKFVTSCSRPPLLGFAHLQPQFSIRCVEVPDDEDTGDTVITVIRGFLRLPSKSRRGSQHHPHRLPTASTCFNLLKLPNYPNKDVLREKLKQAISNNTGFELS